MSSVIIGLSDWSLTSQSDFTEESVMTTAEPLTRYGAFEGRASQAAPLPSSYTTTRDTTLAKLASMDLRAGLAKVEHGRNHSSSRTSCSNL
jgi:hypothetical protein